MMLRALACNRTYKFPFCPPSPSCRQADQSSASWPSPRSSSVTRSPRFSSVPDNGPRRLPRAFITVAASCQHHKVWHPATWVSNFESTWPALLQLMCCRVLDWASHAVSETSDQKCHIAIRRYLFLGSYPDVLMRVSTAPRPCYLGSVVNNPNVSCGHAGSAGVRYYSMYHVL